MDCEVCGRPMRRDNRSLCCTRTTECRAEYQRRDYRKHREERRATARQSYHKRRDEHVEYSRRYRQEHPEEVRTRKRLAYHASKIPPYVYCNRSGNILKLGISERSYLDQRHSVRARAKKMFGVDGGFDMIWHNRGDEWLETMLQLQASRLWTPLKRKTGGYRHSEWFDVGDTSTEDIIKQLRYWRDREGFPADESE